MSRTQSTPHTFVSRLAALIAAGLFALTAASAFAQTQPEAVIPSLITQPINPEVRVTLQHNVHPLAQARYDQGIAPGSMATGRIMLVLKRSDMQEQALKEYLGDLQNPNSPNYRKWLTPAQFGNLYSISNSDLTTVTAWLQSQGFTIDKIPQARNVIIFSGNVAQIQQAFNTSIHKYLINGETHFANSTDPQVPAALAPVIAGIAQLNDFRPKPGAILKSKAHFDNDENRIKPDLTLSNSSGGQFLFTDPADAATIYDTPNSTLNPKHTGTNYDGTGVTLGIAGDSNITAGDVALYRAAFLPSSYSSNQPNIIVDGNDPGINGDAVEALLDLEVSGGIAPGAKVNFYTSADTDLQAGLFLAVFRALDDNSVSILNVSFGACEANEGASGNAEVLAAWEQAAAQGISVTVATGDSGSASCDNDNSETAAQFGLAVSGIASTPYNIAVGGTDYDVLANSFSTYVAASNSSQNAASTFYRTALSYIPESPWNDSTSTNAGGYTANQPLKDSNGNTNIAGGGGGISSCSDQTSAGACLGGYATPPFQTGLSGFPYTARALPDVSFLAADGLYNALWVVCSDYISNGSPTAAPPDCEQTNGSFTSATTFSGVGGTSAAAPAFAGMLALVSQSQGGVRLGQANNVLYNLAAQSALYPTVFHDVTTGNNSVVCESGTTNCGSNDFLTGYNAGTGYDAASGLGSVDVSQLIANWTKAVFTPTTTGLTINGGTGAINVKHGTSLNFAVSVSPTAATGDVSIVNNSGVTNNGALGQFLTLSGGKATLSSGDLPGGGPYNVYAYYGGDIKDAASQSSPIQVTISPESSQVAIGATMIDPLTGSVVCDDVTGSAPSCTTASSLQYGLATAVSAQVQGTSGSNTTATGTISFSDSAGSLPNSTVAISNIGVASYNNYINQNQSLPVASNGLTASFGGDPSYSASNSGSAYTLKIVQGPTSVAVAGSQTGTTVTLQAQVNTDSIGIAPTGAVTFKVGSTTLGTAATASGTGFVSSGTVASLYQISIPATTAGLVNGSNTITAIYAGNTNYVTSSGSATVAITGGGSGGSFSLSGPPISIAPGATTGNTSTISLTPAAAGFTGTVSLTCAITASPSGATNLPTCTMNPASVALSGTTAGSSTLAVTTISTTTPGSYTITVTGTSGSNTASTPISLTVTGGSTGIGSFTITGTAVSVAPGATTGNTSTITVTPPTTFAGTATVNLSCAVTSSPTGAMDPPTCSLSSSSLTITGAKAATSTMTITTTPSSSGALTYPLKNIFTAAGGAVLACVLMFTIPARRKGWRAILSLLAFAVAITAAIGCGGGGSNNGGNSGTTAGTYVITVTGTSGTVTETGPVSLTVN